MVKCISELCRQLVDPGSLDNDLESSSPFRGKEPLKIISRPYDKLLMVKSISRDSEKLNAVEPALKHFRFSISGSYNINFF